MFSKRYRAHRCGVEVMLHLRYLPPVGHEERDFAYGTMGELLLAGKTTVRRSQAMNRRQIFSGGSNLTLAKY